MSALALRLAWRDLRGGLGPLRLLLACLILGVAALAGVGSLAGAIGDGLAANGRSIVGGDVEMRVSQRLADPAERAAFAAAGRVSETVRLRAMAARADGRDSTLIELKAVDGAYPLYGRLVLAPGGRRPNDAEIAIVPALAGRLGVRVGDVLVVGAARLRVSGLIAAEPDRLGEGFAFGPVALVDPAGLAATGLVRPGSLYGARYRIMLPADRDAATVAAGLKARFAEGGWDTRDRSDASPAIRRFVGQLGQFLTLVGLAALAVAGIGVGNGVASWADARAASIATLKTLGATSGLIFRIYLTEVAMVAGLAVAIGLAIGVAVPPLAASAIGDALPVAAGLTVHPRALAVAAAYGLLIALLFALRPLARARRVTAATLFRGAVDMGGAGIGWRVRLVQGVVAAAIVGLAFATSDQPRLTLGFIGGTIALFAALGAIGWAIRRGVAALPRPRRPLLRLALANLHRPGAVTGRLVVALGLGLTLFVALAGIETSLGSALSDAIPARAPAFFALDIQREDVPAFRAAVGPGAAVTTVPMLRGAVVAIGDRRVAEMKDIPAGAWILRGDRGLTYTATLPPGNTITAGRWWPADYAGPPLVSVDETAAKALGLRIGEVMTVSVLGVEISARIASFRRIEWERMGFNFAILFAPGALEGAPHGFAATVSTDRPHEDAVARAVSRRLPEVTMIRVRDVIGQVGAILGRMAGAIRAAAAVALLAGVAVLIGAVAASRRARAYDAVVLKTLGASRGQVLAVQALEFAFVAVILSLFALAAGSGAAWYVVTGPLGLPWAPDRAVVLATLAIGAVGTMAIGVAATLPALNVRPSAALRTL